ncbi:MAG: hypothetical protein GEV28_01645 [Actinophytocola sp.]|uniref:hypothetical protein n=1 Tax=Actinophytocola sp. TaxID=1872138 RepID=UPI00132AD936|nr:hypothetical protein [Actinophytocola sp.]MPZ79156.1 hypothetical protein [Actinophytocola sp.]
MFKRRKQRDPQPARSARGGVFDGLRGQVLHLDPAADGMARTPSSSLVWGGMMETAHPNGTASLVCLRNGTTSLYTSTGGGIIGGGAHAAVVSANEAFLAELTAHATSMRPDTDESLPAEGRVVLRALTYDGPMIFEAAEDDLGYHRSVLSPVFHAAHEVITQLRLLDEHRSPDQ